jgi:tetratricopeptide (TPR) repeat protein
MNRLRQILVLILLIPAISKAGNVCNEAATSSLESGLLSFSKRTDLQEAKLALDKFSAAAKSDPACAAAFTRAAHAAWWVADHATVAAEKTQIFQQGMDWAKAAVAIDSHSADARFWLAANMGSYGEARGVLKSLFLVKPIRHELEEVLNIDPAYDRGAALRVLGVVDYKVPGIAGGSRKRALENLSKALVLGPDVGANRYYLAEYYATVGDKEKALREIAVLFNLTTSEDDRPELLMMQDKGRLLEKRLKGKNS